VSATTLVAISGILPEISYGVDMHYAEIFLKPSARCGRVPARCRLSTRFKLLKLRRDRAVRGEVFDDQHLLTDEFFVLIPPDELAAFLRLDSQFAQSEASFRDSKSLIER
jgi:hypothetical protein